MAALSPTTPPTELQTKIEGSRTTFSTVENDDRIK